MEEATADFKGTNARVTVVERPMANDTANVPVDRKKRLNITTHKGFINVPVSSGIHDDYEDWSFKLKSFLTTENRWFGELLRVVANRDSEVKDYDIDDFVQNRPEVHDLRRR